MIPLSRPTLDGNEVRYVHQCLASGYVSSVGAFVDRFERDFARTVGAKHAVACSSGTAALHVALRLAGAERGRLVAVSDFTFIASANAVSYTGAELMLVDSEPETWNMNTERLYDEVEGRARTGQPIPDIVEVVHVLGHPAVMEPLLALRERYGIRIVEDAAESLGASWLAADLEGRHVGTVGDLGCFSFNGNKTITTGAGGMIVTDDAELAARAKHLTTQAKRASDEYVHDTIGYNYRMSNLSAALGVAQLETLADKVSAKQAIADRYAEWLATLPLTLAPRADWANPTHWLYSVLLTDGVTPGSDVVASMAERGIQARRVWPPLHRQAPYASTERLGGAIAEDIYRRGLSLPSSADLCERDQKAVTTALAEALKAPLEALAESGPAGRKLI